MARCLNAVSVLCSVSVYMYRADDASTISSQCQSCTAESSCESACCFVTSLLLSN